MRIFNSIKWRLQLWYGLILVLVLAGFGFTAYQLERGRQMRRIDDELQRRFGAVVAALRPPPHGPPPGGQPLGPPPSDQFPAGGPPPENLRRPGEFRLPSRAADLFDAGNPNNFYFMVFRDGKEFACSTNAPPATKILMQEINDLAALNRPFRNAVAGGALPKARVEQSEISAKDSLSVVRSLPSGEVVLIGCSIMPEMKELRLAALRLTVVGVAILLVGLAGGWWLVGRAIRPIEDISATAVKIAAGNLSQRINIAETENELGRLAGVLNSTFARLETAFAQQQQFTSDAAHELRTPVSVMLTQTQTTLNRERSAGEYRETVETCQRAAQRMRRLIESLLELARLDAGQEPMKRMRFDLSQTVGECLELVRPLAAERNVCLQTDLLPTECTGDAERLAQVVTNLLTNAIQYNQPGGEVRVATRRQNDTAILTVTDTGRGIAAEDVSHIFERFYRGDKSRTAANGNAGLGLAISRAIVEAHGGTIEVASQVEVGTTFTVRLPA